MYGWAGTILRVDLSSGKIEKEPLSEELRRNYLGGRGINSRILYDEVRPGTDPFAPENRLIFGTGPLSGTLTAAGRLTVTAKSPITYIHGDANAGGHFSPELKYAGYDHIVFTGKADKPVYLWIDDDNVELRDARHLWGKTTDVTDRMLKEELGYPGKATGEAVKEEMGDPKFHPIHIAYIGPGGENLVRFACVMTDLYGACGRTGMGAVMGAKNLKAVAVRGTKGVKLAQPEVFRTLALNSIQRLMQNRMYALNTAYGTLAITDWASKRGMLTIRGGQHVGKFSGIDEISAETLKQKYSVRARACSGCIQHCRHWYEIEEGPYAGEKGMKLEYGAVAAWGPLCDNSYAPSIYKLNNLCNQYGIDVINAGEMVAAAMEWYERGLITKEDTEGIELEWGNYEAEVEMCHKIALREGFGDVLAEGPLGARKVGKGAEECLTTAKGMLYTVDDSRYSTAFTLAKAVSTRGADHLRGMGLTGRPTRMSHDDVTREFGPGVRDFSSYDDKAKSVYYSQGIATIADALELCKYSTEWHAQEMDLQAMAELFSAATGMKVDGKDMREIADRIWSVERAFSVREGITRKDDTIVGRQWNEPSPSGQYKGFKFDQKGWDKMLDEYYELVGWGKETGAPTRAKLEELGLKGIADELESMGKL